MIWNFETCQESRMTTFSLVVLPIFMKTKYYISTCVRNAHCLRIDFRRWHSRCHSLDEAFEKDITEEKHNIKSSMLSNSVGGLFFPYALYIFFIESEFSILMAYDLAASRQWQTKH